MNKKALSVMMAGALAVCSAGCANKTTADDVKKLTNGNYYVSEKGVAAEYNSLYFDFLGGKDVMPIGGFYGVYNSGGTIDGLEIPQMVSDKYFGLISDAGVNMVVYSRDEDSATVKGRSNSVKIRNRSVRERQFDNVVLRKTGRRFQTLHRGR